MTRKIDVSPRVLETDMMSPATRNLVARLESSAPSGKLYWGLIAVICEDTGCRIGSPHIIHFDDGKFTPWQANNLPDWIDQDLAAQSLNAIYEDKPLPKFSDSVDPHGKITFNLVFMPGNLVWAHPIDILSEAEYLQGVHPVEPNLWRLGFFLFKGNGSSHQAIEAHLAMKDSQKLWQCFYSSLNALGEILASKEDGPERIFKMIDPVFPLPEGCAAE